MEKIIINKNDLFHFCDKVRSFYIPSIQQSYYIRPKTLNDEFFGKFDKLISDIDNSMVGCDNKFKVTLYNNFKQTLRNEIRLANDKGEERYKQYAPLTYYDSIALLEASGATLASRKYQNGYQLLTSGDILFEQLLMVDIDTIKNNLSNTYKYVDYALYYLYFCLFTNNLTSPAEVLLKDVINASNELKFILDGKLNLLTLDNKFTYISLCFMYTGQYIFNQIIRLYDDVRESDNVDFPTSRTPWLLTFQSFNPDTLQDIEIVLGSTPIRLKSFSSLKREFILKFIGAFELCN